METFKVGYEIVSFGNFRFAISDESGKVVDDAQGYGYKTKQSAFKAMSWKLQGGKQKAESQAKAFRSWLKEDVKHPKIIKEFNDQMEWNFKELSRGEVKIADIWNLLERKFVVTVPDYVKKQALKL